MLVLSRKTGEEIVIGRDVRVVVRRISGNRVALGVDAPRGVRVLRGELEPFARAFDPATDDDDEASADPVVVPAVASSASRMAVPAAR